MLCSSVASECLFFLCSNYLSSLNITSPVSAASSPFGMASWLCLLWINNGSPIYHTSSSLFFICLFFLRRLDVDCVSSSPQCSSSLLSFSSRAKQKSVCPKKKFLHILATGCEGGESLTLENEDVVAMGTVNPSVTQRVPGWWDSKLVAFHDTPDMHTCLTGRVCLSHAQNMAKSVVFTLVIKSGAQIRTTEPDIWI